MQGTRVHTSGHAQLCDRCQRRRVRRGLDRLKVFDCVSVRCTPGSAATIYSALSVAVRTAFTGPLSTRLRLGMMAGDGSRANPNTSFKIAQGGMFNNKRD